MNRDKHTFLEILSRYQGILHKVSLVYFRDAGKREDNFQEIVYQLWKSFPTLKNEESIGSWIYAVAINTSLSNLKKEGRVVLSDKQPDSNSPEHPSQQFENKEETEALLEAIQNLGEADKTIMLLYLEEKSYTEIATITGLTESNVGVRINRAKKSLKQSLKYLRHG